MNYQLINADALEGLRRLPDASVHMVCTSPPYWSLRDYNTPPQIWSGAPDCDHVWSEATRAPWANELPGPNGRRLNNEAARQRPKEIGPLCQKCDAWRGSLGLEPTPGLFVRNLVLVFREIWRVLRDDGTLWINLGDSYAGGGNGGGGSFAKDGIRCAKPGTDKNKATRRVKRGAVDGLKDAHSVRARYEDLYAQKLCRG